MKDPKEKALELLNKYRKCKNINHQYFIIPIIEDAKQCALIAVDELIEESIGYLSIKRNEFWKEVKKQIEKL